MPGSRGEDGIPVRNYTHKSRRLFVLGMLTGYFFLSRDRVILGQTVFLGAREIVVCRLGYGNNY